MRPASTDRAHRGGQRPGKELLLGDHLIEPAADQRGVSVDCLGLQCCSRRRYPHGVAAYLERGHRERDADREFGEADGPPGHQSHIGTHGQDAATGDRMSVDRRDDRRGVVVDREKGFRQCADKALGIVGAAVDKGAKVDTGRERPPGTGEHDRARHAFHRGDDDLEQVQIERVHRCVVEPDDRHAVGCLEIRHVPSLPRVRCHGRGLAILTALASGSRWNFETED